MNLEEFNQQARDLELNRCIEKDVDVNRLADGLTVLKYSKEDIPYLRDHIIAHMNEHKKLLKLENIW
jgi:hypothetical protein